eukprot:m51a1_g10657 hypothetical protein (96) ;mRNA; r:38160-38447
MLTPKSLNSKRRNKHSKVENKGSKIASCVPFMQASGVIVMDMFILPFKPCRESRLYIEGLSHKCSDGRQTFWVFTELGCLNAEVWLACLEKLKAI